ncbi:MAG: hypothetical protein J5J00_05965 [Deltaproteobacteria bacterium]|nr:hypothetical protein [Deltaproteobacteria bacterium]
MCLIDKCNQLFKESCLAAFPAVEIDPSFYPALDLEHGDIASRLPQVIGEQLRIDAASAGEELLKRLKGVVSQACLKDNFINVRFERHELVEEVFSGYSSGNSNESLPHEHIIVLPPPHHGLSGLAYIRLCSAALLQKVLLKRAGASVGLRMLCFDKEIDAFAPKELLAFLLRIVEERSFSPAEVSREFTQQLQNRGANDAQLHVWLSTRSLSKRDFKGIVGAKLKLFAHTPEMTWLMPWSESALVDFRASLAESGALLFHLMRPLPALELDLSACRLPENSNLFWLVRNTQLRLNRIFPEGSSKEGSVQSPTQEFEPWSLVRRVLLRHRFFEWFEMRAAYYGEVRQYFAAIEDLLIAANCYMNAPDYRRRAAQRLLSRREIEFVTGIEDRISDIINLSNLLTI